ncbi:MAG: T9SS type A sorting domain-containing protein [Bacteroidia bacterium]|nr:T9SS type A sorting domain-containing protein [Bacteroidia bacterium]
MNPRIFAAMTVGIQQPEKPENTLMVYPNPATNQLAISSMKFAIKEIEVYDVLGQKVYSEQLTVNNKQHIIDVSRLNVGIYFVVIRDEKNKSMIRKVVKM